MGKITKVMKYQLTYLDGCGSFKDMQEAVWDLQRQTREILNKTIQICSHWSYNSKEYQYHEGETPKLQDKTGYKSYGGYAYDCIKDQYLDMHSDNKLNTVMAACKKYTNSALDVLTGEMSLPSYKKDQPIIITAKNIHLSYSDKTPVVELSLFSPKFKKEKGWNRYVRFALVVKDGTQKAILRDILEGRYQLGQSQLIYDKKKWFLLLAYSFEPKQHQLDPNKILGVDLGEVYAIYASSTSGRGTFKIDGGEITAYAKQIESRKRSLQQQARHCGEGRIGHGTHTRLKPVYKARNRISNFRETINHRYSKDLVAWAVRNGYGTIQMEDLTGIKEDLEYPKHLQHWAYYDLQMKIKYKAAEHGIIVKEVDPKYTSQRCSKCGHIDSLNRTSQERFCCTACGFKSNADFNASQNLSIDGIDKIIKKQLGLKSNDAK